MPWAIAMLETDAPGSRHCRTNSRLSSGLWSRLRRLEGVSWSAMVCVSGA